MLFLFSLLIIFLTCSSAYSQSVVIFENPNFGGRAKTVGVGEHRLLDFDRVASSVRVPTGLAAIIYEHADQGGGYGRSVDLLEDQPDLSVYDLNDRISYVTVFSTKRQGFYWKRNSLQNGQFIAGHWERAKAGGTPDERAEFKRLNAIAVVSPPLPSHAAAALTRIQVNGAKSTITSLHAQSSADADYWKHAEIDLMGVIGSDYRGIEEIGSAAVERASHDFRIPDTIKFWYPQKERRDHRDIYFKRTLSGIINPDPESPPYIASVNGTYEDHDINIEIIPAARYMYLITEGHEPKLSLIQRLKLKGEHPRDEIENPCTEPFTVVGAEIDMRPSAKAALFSLIRPRAGTQISVYGPWIYDIGHCHHPEIHPAEQIWWTENVGANKQYHLNLFCDSSQRFWWLRQLDGGTKLKPWAEPPIKGTFAIAFEAEIPTVVFQGVTKQFEVSGVDSYNVAAFFNYNRTYDLVYQGRTLVSFVPHSDAFKVSFEKVGLKPGTANIVQGFLVIETTVGKITQAKKEAGHYMFSVLRTDVSRQPLIDH